LESPGLPRGPSAVLVGSAPGAEGCGSAFGHQRLQHLLGGGTVVEIRVGLERLGEDFARPGLLARRGERVRMVVGDHGIAGLLAMSLLEQAQPALQRALANEDPAQGVRGLDAVG
jgi:hypothetical protein